MSADLLTQLQTTLGGAYTVERELGGAVPHDAVRGRPFATLAANG